LDLSKGPQVLRVPDFSGRYYSVQFTDPFDIDFAYVGTRTTGTQVGDYLITGPDWKGQVPSGMTQIASPANSVLVLGRILVYSDAALSTAYNLNTRRLCRPLGRACKWLFFHRTQRHERRFLRGADARRTSDIHACVRAIGPQGVLASARRNVPQLDRFVGAAAGDPPAIGAEADRLDAVGMPTQCAAQAHRVGIRLRIAFERDIPQPHGIICRTCRQQLGVWMERYRRGDGVRSGQAVQHLAALCIP